ncbi:glycosyltransferase [Jannaschia rubra]|uniref:GalNAc(5)-diNAcBac-PP-undecaprenol beta-1,3-glucosyltransferase n=1 Tax=Jannaschia rubra TaxID=282197 RepID=A0A0M6XNH9_9RHOB|nr:glycosyltransferase [Jannaschia rubra]CTQ32730.1 GalNAc(5)-diNAcBac-PP-undecaprenol beta-1,3-glucosyltransferase [Jannaschia rubra]SFF88410.1 Glycosyltransferase involved in cell wall bisynthesis [Jannaschia rubra]
MTGPDRSPLAVPGGMSDVAKALFRGDWYLDRYADVRDGGLDPLAHYLSDGWRERRAPHPVFDAEWYAAQVAAGLPGEDIDGKEALSHYLSRGWRAVLSPHPLFDPAWYLMRHAEVLAADADPWLHYLREGWKSGCRPAPLFDLEWYLDRHPDLRLADVEPFGYYLQTGWREGRSPHPLFDAEWYRRRYADIDGCDAWRHYVETGWKEGRSPHPLFDAGWYQDRHLDTVARDIEPLSHYLDHGWREGLAPHPDVQSGPTPEEGADQAPLYRMLTAAAPPVAMPDLTEAGQRGRILLVTHETEVGGAPRVVRILAEWLQRSTRFSVGIVAMGGGNLRSAFEKVAPLIVLSDHAEEDRAEALAAWAGDDVRAILVNSVASGNFYRYWTKPTPSVAFLHELDRVLALFPGQIDLIRDRADHVIAGGPEVAAALRDGHGFDPTRLTAAASFVENGSEFDPDIALARRRAARFALDVPEDAFLVMGCGTLHWRKSPDKFVETAERLRDMGVEARFVWLGGGPDEKACRQMVRDRGIEHLVRFTGYEADVPARLAGADVFLLPSEEDPFPLVALYAAQAAVPIVCFEGAGGIAGFVTSGSGVAVPFMDTEAMAAAVAAYAADAEARRAAGAAGQAQVARGHTVATAGPRLLDHLRRVAGLAPEVSVVVPNYNYEAYLPERLRSIAGQTFQDFEVILLDDASSDGSAALLEDFAETRPGTRVVLGERNSGSPFAQWLRGMEMAQADVVWLAEADDHCTPDLLATLVPMFDDRNMRLASCASVPVRADGSVIGDYRPIYLDRIAPGRWDADFVATDHEEANGGLGIANTIPNASAVLLRRFVPDADFVDRVTRMRLCGDWFFYVRAMRGGRVGFSAAAMNFHRRHDRTVTHRMEGSTGYFEELAQVRAYLGQHYRRGPDAKARIARFLAQDVERFGVTDPQALPDPGPQAKAMPTLLVVAPDLSPGGGQVFSISLANEWVRRGGIAILFDVANQPAHPAVVSKIDPGVMFVTAGDPGATLPEIVARHDVDVIQSSIWWSDAMVESCAADLPDALPWVITMHGCHETLLAHPTVVPDFAARLDRMKARANAWVHTAAKNLAVFDRHGRPETLLRIPNGMAEDVAAPPLDRATLGLRPDAVVLCLASRALPSKGWAEAVDLTEAMNAEGHAVDLMLIGEGAMAAEVEARAADHVHLMGQVANLQDYLAVADIGLLPSYFVGESLPLVLLEMMAKSLPVVASTIGEIPAIVGTGPEAGGLLVPLTDSGIDTGALLSATRRLLDPDLRTTMGARARARFEEDFTLAKMVDRYAALYDDLGARTWRRAAG